MFSIGGSFWVIHFNPIGECADVANMSVDCSGLAELSKDARYFFVLDLTFLLKR